MWPATGAAVDSAVRTIANGAQRDIRREPPLPGRLYYGWVMVGVLAVTVTVSYGILMYAFPVVLAPMQADLGWSQAMLTGGFSLAALTAGVMAIPVGAWVDRYGPRAVMTTGSVAATVLLLAWSRVSQPLGYYLVWTGLGACMAAVFYEPAFAVIARWFQRGRGRALTVLTLAGGLASTLFVPFTSWLVLTGGWRSAVMWLALSMGLLTILPHALLLRHPPPHRRVEHNGMRMANGAHIGRAQIGHAQINQAQITREPSMTASVALRSSSFRWLTAAFVLSTIVNFAVAVHLVPILLERGFAMSAAALALAVLGLAKLPGRLLIAPLCSRVSAPVAVAVVFALQVVALIAVITVPGAGVVWVFVTMFGAGDGASTPARAEIVASFFGSLEYGRIGGVLAFFLAAGRAAAPVGASLAHALFGAYDAVLWIMAATLVAAAAAMMRAGSRTLASFSGKARLPV